MSCDYKKCGKRTYGQGWCADHFFQWYDNRNKPRRHTPLEDHWLPSVGTATCTLCGGPGAVFMPKNRLENPPVTVCVWCVRVVSRDTGQIVTSLVMPGLGRMDRLTILYQLDRNPVSLQPEYGEEGEMIGV